MNAVATVQGRSKCPQVLQYINFQHVFWSYICLGINLSKHLSHSHIKHHHHHHPHEVPQPLIFFFFFFPPALTFTCSFCPLSFSLPVTPTVHLPFITAAGTFQLIPLTASACVLAGARGGGGSACCRHYTVALLAL